MPLRSSLLLTAALLTTLLLGSAAAQSDPWLAPPSGPVDPHGRVGVDPSVRGHGQAPRQVRRGHRPRPAVRAAIVARFDRNQDGRLTGRERAHAKRFVAQQRRQLREDRAGRDDRRDRREQRRDRRGHR